MLEQLSVSLLVKRRVKLNAQNIRIAIICSCLLVLYHFQIAPLAKLIGLNFYLDQTEYWPIIEIVRLIFFVFVNIIFYKILKLRFGLTKTTWLILFLIELEFLWVILFKNILTKFDSNPMFDTGFSYFLYIFPLIMISFILGLKLIFTSINLYGVKSLLAFSFISFSLLFVPEIIYFIMTDGKLFSAYVDSTYFKIDYFTVNAKNYEFYKSIVLFLIFLIQDIAFITMFYKARHDIVISGLIE